MRSFLALFFNPLGRINRVSFIVLSLWLFSITATVYCFSYLQFTNGMILQIANRWTDMDPLFITFLCLNTYSFLVLFVKRMHDMDASGLWVLVFIFFSISPFLLKQLQLLQGTPFVLEYSLPQIAPLALVVLCLLVALLQPGTFNRNHYGIPPHMIFSTFFKQKKSSKAASHLPPPKPQQKPTRADEMKRSYTLFQSKKTEELKEKMRVSTPSKKDTMGIAG